ARCKSALDGRATPQVTQRGTNGRIAASRLVVGVFQHFINIVVYSKCNPFAEVIDVDHCLICSFGMDFNRENYTWEGAHWQYRVIRRTNLGQLQSFSCECILA